VIGRTFTLNGDKLCAHHIDTVSVNYDVDIY